MSRYFPPIPDDRRCHCQEGYPFVRHHYPWEHAVNWAWYSGNPTGPSMRYGYVTNRSFEEHWVVAAVIEALLQHGYSATDMALERTIERGTRPDLTVEPSTGPVEIWEAKRAKPSPKDRDQAARYLSVGQRLWPDRTVRVFLVYPIERGATTLRVEAIH